MPLPVIILIALLALINLAVSLQIRHSPHYEPRQKQLQYLLIWFLPVIGAVITWAINRHVSVRPDDQTASNTLDDMALETTRTRRENHTTFED